ncbi:rRNA methyltransferase 1, mitochondrial [Wickerhamiella sorbophila]|uniref:rRNA methyltransferase 1, mitochondrial n=1 Tax=Wickerhamiella sorbophila TaxID=45607 RepID=A0A2T0FJA9_9ASCO|nr:rRNA methyltransferase 1, mitochondrial [Wickerhamiella sorbophila]PRT55065.1 rRNA methyltransferase 1, mitochondrial [Wickerhamiella sorbophila]
MKSSLFRWAPKAPFKTSGKRFDDLFVNPKAPKKAWDGQDKDSFFRDKYAHVHAKQLQRRKEEQNAKKKREGGSKKIAVPAPKPDKLFAERIKAQMDKDSRLEHMFGTSAVLAALETRQAVKLYSGNRSADTDIAIMKKCSDLDVPVVTSVPAQHLNILTNNGVHNKYVLTVHKREFPSVVDLPLVADDIIVGEELKLKPKRTNPLGLYIDEVTDTHNMGAILRSAYWFGVDFVSFSRRNCAPISPQVVKASAGAAEFLPILEVPQPLKFFENLTKNNWNVISSTTPSSRHKLPAVLPEELPKLLEDGPCLLVVGSEGEGIRTSLLQRSTHRTALEAVGQQIDSLNVSVATALLLSAFGAPK